MDLHGNFTTDVFTDKEKLIKFWNSSVSESGSEIFEGFFIIARWGIFSTMWLISLVNLIESK